MRKLPFVLTATVGKVCSLAVVVLTWTSPPTAVDGSAVERLRVGRRRGRRAAGAEVQRQCVLAGAERRRVGARHLGLDELSRRDVVERRGQGGPVLAGATDTGQHRGLIGG